MAIDAGTRFGHYHILSPLGAGGMGEVWQRHPDGGKLPLTSRRD